MSKYKRRQAALGGLLSAVCCIAAAPSALGRDISVKFAFAIERFYRDSLDAPSAVFVDKERQEVYVADSGRGEILIFDTKGAPIARFGKSEGISNPVSIVVKAGRVYVSQEGKPYIEIFNYRGDSVDKIAPPEGMPFSPGKMAIDEDGALYVINKAGTNCVVFDSKDKFSAVIGKGLVSTPQGIAAANGRLYLISSFGGYAVRIYDKQGIYIAGFEGLQDLGGSLGLPVSARIDKNGMLWLVDALRGIFIYDKDLKKIAQFGEYGAGKWQFSFPVDIDFDKENMVYIADKNAKRVSVFKIER